MKKFFIFAVASLMMSLSANAQEGYDNTKHEIALGYGIYSNSQWIDVMEEVSGIIFGGEYENEKFIGPISAEYFYRFKKWLGVGGIFVYGRNQQDMMDGGVKDAEASHNYLTLMPAAKFDWLRKKNWGLYSKLALGATFRTQKVDYEDPTEDDVDDSAVHFNWQATLIGVEAGSPNIRGFLEFGVGEQGLLLLGVRYKF